MTYADLERIYISQLSFLYDAEEAKSLAYYAIEHISKLTKAQLLLHKQKEVPSMDEASLTMILDELKAGKPVQYITGETEFFGLRFRVNPSVLIPRPETEELVDWVLNEVGEMKDGKDEKLKEGFRILDIGTGSGCIPIVLKKYLSDAEVCGLDISAGALETALKNGVLNQTEVKFIHADILDLNFNLPTRFNIIISNPPYITLKEKEQMHKNVLEHEPQDALFVPDQKALIFYERIADFAINHFVDNGLLFFEINENFGEETAGMLQEKGFSQIELRKDLMGKDRMIKAVFKK